VVDQNLMYAQPEFEYFLNENQNPNKIID